MSSLFDIVLALVVLAMGWPIVRVRIATTREPGERTALIALLDRALVLRAAMALVLNTSFAFGTGLGIFWGDSAFYDQGAWQKMRVWSGENTYTFDNAFGGSGYGWANLIAAIYYVFGRNQILVQFVNAVLSTLTVLVVYELARQLFGVKVAMRAGRFMAYFPQMIIWAAGLYKDPAILLSIAVAMLAVTRLRDRFTASWLLLYLGSALWLLSLRFYVFYFLVIATVGTFLFGQRRGFVGSVLSQGVLAVAFLVTFSAVIGTTTAESQIEMMLDLQDLQRRREDLVQSAGSGFAAEVDISTPGGALTAIPIGAVYLLFAPFPWAISGFRQALTIPETLYWYSLMPAFLTGLRVTLRARLGPALPMLVFAATLIGAYSVMQGNSGTAYRQRTQITMFFFILMAVGLEEKEQRLARARAGRVGLLRPALAPAAAPGRFPPGRRAESLAPLRPAPRQPLPPRRGA